MMWVRCQGAAVLAKVIREGPLEETTAEQRPEQSGRACCLDIRGKVFQTGAASANL